MQPPVYLQIFKVDITELTNICLSSQNPGIRRNNPAWNVSLWTSLSFLEVNQQKRVGMVSKNKM